MTWESKLSPVRSTTLDFGGYRAEHPALSAANTARKYTYYRKIWADLKCTYEITQASSLNLRIKVICTEHYEEERLISKLKYHE